MTQERIDIVVSEDGSRVVKRNLEDIGTGAKTSQTAVDKLNDTLSKTSGATDKLKATGAAALESAKGFKIMEAAGLLLRGAVLALSAAVGAFIGAALLQLVVGMYQGWQQSNALRKELIALGGTAGDSASAFESMAQQVGASTGRLNDSRAAVVALAQTGKVSFAQLKDLGQATVDLAFLTGSSVDSMASKLANLGTDTSKTVADLNRQYGLFNVTIYEQVRALEDQGRTQEAANLAAKALADDTHERAVKAVDDMGWIERRLEMLRSAYDDFKSWTMSLGRDATLNEQYDDSLKKVRSLGEMVTATDNIISRATGAHARNQAAYNAAVKESLDLNKQLYGVGGEVQKSAENAAKQQAGKDALAASAATHDMLESTGKLNVLQQKLNENTARYKIMWDSMKAGNAPSELLKGVTRDAKGNFSGGSYNDSVSAIVDRYSPKAAQHHGLTEEEKEAKKRQTYLKQLESSLERYSGRASIAARAQNDLTNAQVTFDAAVKEGFITQDEANKYMEQLRIRTRDALDPLAALNREIDKQTALMKLSADQQQVQATLMSDIQSLQARGQILTDKDIAQLRAKITAQQELGRIMQIQNGLQQGSQSERDKNRGRGNQAVSNLLNDKDSGFNKDDAFNAMSGGLPKDVFAGTKEASKQNIKVMKDMFQQIDDMRKLDVISEQSANIAKMNVWLSYSQSVAQTASSIFGNLAALQSSSNKKAATIGKSAAIAQALMNTYSGATAAFQSAAQIPYVGWILAPVAAGAAIVAGMAQVAAIRSTPTGQGFAYGGDFTVGGVGGTDSQNVAFRATPGERVTINTPQQAQAIEDAARRRDDGKRRGGDFKQTVIVNVKGKPDRKTPAQQARAIRHETMKEYSRS